MTTENSWQEIHEPVDISLASTRVARWLVNFLPAGRFWLVHDKDFVIYTRPKSDVVSLLEIASVSQQFHFRLLKKKCKKFNPSQYYSRP